MEETKKGEEGRNHEASPTKFSNLPQDVFFEILLLLPTRSLGRLRCVSKLFHSLLSDPKLTKMLLDHNVVRSCHGRLMVYSKNLYAVDFDSIHDGCEGLTRVEFDYPLKKDQKKGDRVRIFGSSNGLVCISSNLKDIFLYNPTTKESKRIPDLPKSMCSKSNIIWFSHGFGFDSLTNDYKVVKLLEYSYSSYVYSLKTDSWRRIYNLHYAAFQSSSPVELNGAIHWISRAIEEGRGVVIAFDLMTDKFRVMSLPDLAKKYNYIGCTWSTVGTLKGRLCLVLSDALNMHDDLWVMNEYGVESSWSKIRISISFYTMKPLCSIKNDDEVLLMVNDSFVLYNFECNTWRIIRNCRVGHGSLLQATYVESLISPNSYSVELEKIELLF